MTFGKIREKHLPQLLLLYNTWLNPLYIFSDCIIMLWNLFKIKP